MKHNDEFKDYLTNQFGRSLDPAKYGQKKLSYVNHNYASLLPPERASTILDIGPGFGEVMEWLVKQRGYSNVSGIDISPQVVNYCNIRLPGSTTLVEDTSEFLLKHEQKYDFIFMLQVLEHIPKVQAVTFMSSVKHALTPGGCAIIEVPNMSNPITGLHVRFNDFTHEIGYTGSSLEFVMRSANFSRVQIRSVSYPLDKLSRILQLLVHIPLETLMKIVLKSYGLPTHTVTPVISAICYKD